MLAPDPSVGPGRVLHKSVQAEEPDAMTEFQKKLLTRFVTSCRGLFVLERRIAAFWPEIISYSDDPYRIIEQ